MYFIFLFVNLSECLSFSPMVCQSIFYPSLADSSFLHNLTTSELELFTFYREIFTKEAVFSCISTFVSYFFNTCRIGLSNISKVMPILANSRQHSFLNYIFKCNFTMHLQIFLNLWGNVRIGQNWTPYAVLIRITYRTQHIYICERAHR